MGNLLAYSGIVTKIRAMKSKLLTPEQFEAIAALNSVPEVVDYLRKNTAYAEALRKFLSSRSITITQKFTDSAVRSSAGS